MHQNLYTSCIKTQIEERAGSMATLLPIIETNVFWATESRASLGHFVYQSIVQQFTNDGNMRHRRLENILR